MKSFKSTSTALLLLALLAPVAARGEAPPISDPNNRAPAGSMPGTFPTTVTAANVNDAPIAGSVLNGSGSNNLLVSFPASGPIKWTEPRHNEGDLAFNIGPFNPNDPSYFPPTSNFENYNPLEGDQPFANTTLGWRINQQRGAALASVRTNGVNNGDTFNGSPVGVIHGVANFAQTGAQGWGYNMDTGEFANGGSGSVDLIMGIAGFDQGNGEASFNTAVAFFPYEQGWKGAWVNGSDEGPAIFTSGSPGLDSSTVSWTSNVATVTLPGVNSATSGMLFVSPTHDNNLTNIASALPSDGGWKVAVRDDETVAPTVLADFSQNSFQFLYVPYAADKLIGGEINGATGTSIHEAGGVRFDLARTAAGKYALTVFAADGVTKLNGNQGMVILSGAGALPSDPTLPDNAFFSYQYDAASSAFLIESRKDVASNSPNSQNQFGDDLALSDANFYFAWVDFANPLTPNVAGDFNKDGLVDAADLQTWRTATAAKTADADADGDGDSDGNDFLIWQRNVGAGAATGIANAVPEPGAMALVIAAVAALAARRRIG